MCGRTGMSWRRRSTPGSRTESRGGDDRVCLRRGEGLRCFQGGRETWKTASWQPAGSRIRLPLKESDIPVAVNPKSADGSSNNPQCGFWDSQFSAAQVKSVEQPWRIMIAIGDKIANRWHLQIADRWVTQYNFYINDEVWGRIFVRICPYLPFSARVCLNQHHWLANRMRQQGIAFNQLGNAFLKCSAPDRLQKLADSLAPRDLASCGQKWLAHLTPFFTASERQHAGCQHRLFFSQVELCDNLIFRRRAALDKLGERLLDANRTIGQPEKITVIFGRKITKRYRGKLQTEIEDMNLPNPVIRSHYANGFIKQYVRDHLILRGAGDSM